MNITLLFTIIIFFVFSLWFINKYLSILYKKEDMPETDLKESNVIPNLINSVNKNDQRILDEVNKSAEQIGDIENTLQNKMNQIETNRHNIDVLSDSITGIGNTVQSDNLKTLGSLEKKLEAANNTEIGEAVSNLKSAWEETNEIAMSNINKNINQKKTDIQRDIFDVVSSNVENSFVSNSNFVGFSNSVYGSIGDLSASTSSNTTRIALLEESSSGYVSATDFATFSNNAITKSSLSTHLPDHLSQDSLNSNYLQTSAINTAMSEYLTTNNYLTSSTLTGYATTGSVESLSNSLSNYLKTEDADTTMSNYLNANSYLTTDSTLTGYATTSNMESLSNSLSNYLKTTDAGTTMSNYLSSNNYINSNNFNEYTSNFVSQIDFVTLSNSLSNLMRTTEHNDAVLHSGLISSDDSDTTASNTERITALSNDMINGALFNADSNLLMLQQNNGSNISVDLSSLASATATSVTEVTEATASFAESNLSLSLDSTSGLCVRYGESYSNCISMSNMNNVLWTKSNLASPS
uniref:Uncharacterized protein n=1 Tax=viral metagenome TaxID=1070528 RepID=A0A6C0CVJ5_9ZZZZ